MGQIQSIDELIGLLIRRRLLIGAVAVFGVVMTLLYVMAKPDVFESGAVIQVQTPIVTDPTSGVQVPSQSAQRLQAIEQRLTTRENMLAVIARHGLYDGLPLSDDEKVHLLRLAVRFQPVASVASPQFGAPSQVSA
ncbi:MAG: Wzz/FepE/Etk N-terminal domain-containing protein, partial [Pseudorhodobacter sp.]